MKIFTISASSLNELQNCDRKWFFYKKLALAPIGGKAYYLEEGEILHEVLRSHYSDLMKRNAGDESYTYDLINENAITAGRALAASNTNLDAESVEAIFKNYREYSEYFWDDGWRPVAVETPFTYILYENPEFKFPGNGAEKGLKIAVEGRIDLITDTRQSRFVVDHKYVAKKENVNILSNQFAMYSLVTGISDVIVNRVGKQKTVPVNERMQRPILSYNKHWLEEWKAWVIDWIIELILKMDTDRIMRPNLTSCNKFGGCLYRPICEATPDAREWKIESLYKKGVQFDIYAESE